MQGFTLLIPGPRNVFGDLVLVGHFDPAQIAFHDNTPGHIQTFGLVVGFGEFPPGQEVGGSADGTPIFVE